MAKTTLPTLPSRVDPRTGRLLIGSEATAPRKPGGRTTKPGTGGHGPGNPLKPGTKPAPKGSSSFDAESAATIKGYLEAMGLQGLGSEVDRLVRKGLTWPEIQMLLEDPSSTLGKEVARVYPEYYEYRENNPGEPPITIGHIQRYRQDARRMIEGRGLSEAFPDLQERTRKWFVGRVDLAEVSERLDLLEGEVAGLAQNPAVRAELEAWQRYYGVTPSLGELAALVVNPAESIPRLQRKFAAVSLDVAAGREGFGDLSVGEAEQLADTGVTGEQAQGTFGALVRNRELFSALDRGEDAISRDEQLNAGFGLSNAEAARRRIDDRARRRVARFGGGGALATGRSGGFSGLSTGRDT